MTAHKPSWHEVESHPEWTFLSNTPGPDSKTHMVRAWRKRIEDFYGEENVQAGRAQPDGLHTPFALYVRTSVLESKMKMFQT